MQLTESMQMKIFQVGGVLIVIGILLMVHIEIQDDIRKADPFCKSNGWESTNMYGSRCIKHVNDSWGMPTEVEVSDPIPKEVFR